MYLVFPKLARTPRKFKTAKEAIVFAEKAMQDDELPLKWRKDEDGEHYDYTHEQLIHALETTGEVCLQLASDEVVDELVSIVTEEVYERDQKESQEYISKLGQELAASYKTTVAVGIKGINQKTFKPKKSKSKCKWYVGKTDSSMIKKEESGIGRPCKQRKFNSYKDAVEFIDKQKTAKEGAWYIDKSSQDGSPVYCDI